MFRVNVWFGAEGFARVSEVFFSADEAASFAARENEHADRSARVFPLSIVPMVDRLRTLGLDCGITHGDVLCALRDATDDIDAVASAVGVAAEGLGLDHHEAWAAARRALGGDVYEPGS